MINDDEPVGRVLSRREVLKLLGGVGLTLLVGCGPDSPAATSTTAPAGATPTSIPAGATTAVDTANMPACIVRPEMTEGPYFVDERLNRSDIRSDPDSGEVKDGLPLRLTFRISQLNGTTCVPLAGAYVDIWHCDVDGVYSDSVDRSFNTKGQKFLRGYQVTDANGMAQFLTIYPGWYQGRTVHIHFKIRTSLEGGYDFTSQLFFDDSYTDQVYTNTPYSGRGSRGTRNNNDGIYQNGGDQLILQVTESSGEYASSFDIGLQIS